MSIQILNTQTLEDRNLARVLVTMKNGLEYLVDCSQKNGKEWEAVFVFDNEFGRELEMESHLDIVESALSVLKS